MIDNKLLADKDPFDEPLEPQLPTERLILNDTYFAAARNAITVDGMGLFLFEAAIHEL